MKVLSAFQNGSKEGLNDLIRSLILCKNTLTYVDISDNKSINEAIPELEVMIKECKNMSYLNISDLNMQKKHCRTIGNAIIESCSYGSMLDTLIWNFDMSFLCLLWGLVSSHFE